MKAAVVKKGGIISVEEVETPRAGPGEVVVKVSYCGICGSELLNVGKDTFARAIMGHEFSGVIAEVGEGVSSWSVGQRVTPTIFLPCQQCYECVHGMPVLCRNMILTGCDPSVPGAFAEYVKVKTSQLYATPEEITDQEAALNEPLAVSFRAVRLAGITVGSSVAIIGAGTIGLMAIQCAKLAGASGIYVAQRSEPRASTAKQFGADVVINPEKEDFIYEVRQLTGGGVHASVECAGSANAFELAFKSVRPGGRMILVSTDFSPREIVPVELVFGELEIKGSYGHWSEFADGLELLRLRKIKTEGLITKVVPLSDVQEVFNELRQASKHIKVLIAPC